MSDEGVAAESTGNAPVAAQGTVHEHEAVDADGAMYCYRHPDRETRVRCGRCDRPICSRCAMQGPVGFRCRQCGTLAYDPMRSLNARQAALGLLVATGLAAVAGFIASYIGIFGIFVGFIAGGFIAETVIRVIGYKRGPWIVAVVVVGIVAGTLLGFGLDNWMYYSQAIEAGVPPSEIGLTPMAILSDVGVWAVIVGGAMVVGAYTRLR